MSATAPNPMLPVLHTLDPTLSWPETLDSAGVEAIDTHTLQLARQTRGFAEDAEQQAHPAGGAAPAATRADVRVMQWAARASHYADQVIRAAGLFTGDRAGNALYWAITAALSAREAEFDTGHSDERHHKSVLNRALSSAEWVSLSLRTDPVDAAAAVTLFTELLPPGWRWETRPATGQSSGDTGSDRTGERETTFVVTRQPRPSRGDHPQVTPQPGAERFTVTGVGTEPVTIMHTRGGASSVTETCTWAQMCQHIARSQARPAPDTPRHTI